MLTHKISNDSTDMCHGPIAGVCPAAHPAAGAGHRRPCRGDRRVPGPRLHPAVPAVWGAGVQIATAVVSAPSFALILMDQTMNPGNSLLLQSQAAFMVWGCHISWPGRSVWMATSTVRVSSTYDPSSLCSPAAGGWRWHRPVWATKTARGHQRHRVARSHLAQHPGLHVNRWLRLEACLVAGRLAGCSGC